jgi:DNA topoisomerase I
MRIRYAGDDRPGISRTKRGRGFVYRLPDGRVVRDRQTLARIRHLAIPPAWTDVWIARDPAGHLQATGRDARRRKQYRYHADWTAARDRAKYDHLLEFARTLPAVRRQVARDLTAPPLSRARVLATVIALLEQTHIRVGNDEYARENGSFGLTTLQNRHVRVRGQRVEFRFKGKSGVHQAVAVDDPTLAREVRRCQDLPGQTLFEYRDSSNRIRRVGSSDVNEYLAKIAGPDVTAKDFRTWWGTVEASILLRQAPAVASGRERKRVVLAMFDGVARQLGNTRAVCRKCYVHPDIVVAYTHGMLYRPRLHDIKGLQRLSADERLAVALLERMRRQPNRSAPKTRRAAIPKTAVA